MNFSQRYPESLTASTPQTIWHVIHFFILRHNIESTSVERVMKLLSIEKLDNLTSKIYCEFVKSDTSPGHRIAIIKSFKNHFKFPQADSIQLRHAYINLFENDELHQWLSNQEWDFSTWDLQNLRALNTEIESLEFDFSSINEQLIEGYKKLKVNLILRKWKANNYNFIVFS